MKVMLVVGVTTPAAFEEMVTEAFTNGVAVVVAGNEVLLHPAAEVTVTVKVPLVVTTIDCVVAPLLHKYVVPAPALEAVRVTLPP